MARYTCMVQEGQIPEGKRRELAGAMSGAHRLITFGLFLFLLGLLTSLPRPSPCRGPVCPPQGTPLLPPPLP